MRAAASSKSAARFFAQLRHAIVGKIAHTQMFQHCVAFRERELAERFVVGAARIGCILQANLGFVPVEIVQRGVGTGAVCGQDAVGFGDVLRRPIDAADGAASGGGAGFVTTTARLDLRHG